MSKPIIVCRYCGHVKAWHNGGSLGDACVASEGPDWECDCPAWLYGINEDELHVCEYEVIDDDEFGDVEACDCGNTR